MNRISLLGITLSILLMGCATSVPAKVVETPLQSGETLPTPPLLSSSPTNKGQMLPISAQAQMAGQQIKLEVARTPQERAMGLMYRTELAADRGMLFAFVPPQPVSFWMKNTLIPLDMVFLRKGQVKAITANVPPCRTEPCPSYPSGVAIDQVIELRGGRAAELGLKVGDRVNIRFNEPIATPTPAHS
jgi:uncharacterized membrane protein (UPF0127 family)